MSERLHHLVYYICETDLEEDGFENVKLYYTIEEVRQDGHSKCPIVRATIATDKIEGL